MASSFTDAFNKALSRIVTTIVTPKTPRVRTVSRTKQALRQLGTWLESRKRYEITKPRIKQVKERAIPQPEIKPPKLDEVSSRALVRQKEFDMRLHDDPAFMSWVNRMGQQIGAKVKPGLSVSESRLAALCEKFGCEDPLELYEYITSFPEFGYAFFHDAYELDGKNRGRELDIPYRIDEVISMALAQEQVLQDFPIYKEYGITFKYAA